MTEIKQNTAEIYAEYKEKVLGYIVGKINDRHTAEDICSDVFVKVCEKIDSFDSSKSSVSTWIYTITRNTLTDYYRTKKITSEIPEELCEENSVEDEVLNAETLNELADALSKLNEIERNVIIFHYYYNMTFKDISKRMDFSYSYIKYLHNKAIKELRNFF